jgi:hypothetical protein
MASTIDRSSPITWCHRLVAMRRWVGGMDWRILANHAWRWGGQFNGVSSGIDDPAQDGLPRGPGGVALEQFFDRGWFLAMWGIGGFQFAKDQVQGV